MSWYAFILLAITPGLLAGTDVLTGGYTNSRANGNLSETVLNPSTVKTGKFGKLFSLPVDGTLYAQPLYLRNVAIPGKGTHNVVFAATMHNTIYAFDSDQPGMPLWSVNLGPAVSTETYSSEWAGYYSDILHENGILSTPVIDPATGTIYAVAATRENVRYIYRLHALDVATGKEKMSAPSVISASVPGIGDGSVSGAVAFLAEMHLQRPALLLSKGVVYVSFGSHADAAPYHGWIMGYSAANVQSQVSVFNASPNGADGAIWQSGRGLTADTTGNIYPVTSNGTTDGNTNFSDSVLRLDSTLHVRDWFAPSNFGELNDTDTDLGSTGAILVDGTNYLITGGKEGVIYLLDRTRLGKIAASDTGALQTIRTGNFGLFNMALWNRPDGPLLYVHTVNSPVTVYKLSGGKLSDAPVARSMNGFNIPFQGMTISANGVVPGSGVLWILTSTAYPLPSHAILRAYDAEALSEIWNSDMSATDGAGTYVKFANPTVADGKVFVATASNGLVVYGPLTGAASNNPLITSVSNVASYASGSAAPGEMLAIQGANLGPAEIVVNTIPAGQTLSNSLGGTQVLFNGIPGPIFYTSNAIVTALVPYAIADAGSVRVQVVYNGKSSAETTLSVAASAPGLFAADSTGSGPGSILNADYSLNSPKNPAEAGSIVVIYATGGGRTQSPVQDGALTTAANALAGDTQVTVNGTPAEILYAGNAGGTVAGIVQLNIRVPKGATGDLPVVVSTAGQSSQATVTVSVK